VDQADPEIAHYVALGQRNAEVIELFARFCRNVRVEAMGGVGMIEAQTGLPIGHRAFRCAYASGMTAFSMHLEDAAVEFYEEHCRGCADRIRSGLLGENIATLAEARRSASQAHEEKEKTEADIRLRQHEERSARRSRRRAGEPYPSAAQLQRVDRLDPPDGSPESSDIEWLVRTASLGLEVISEPTVAELVELARDEEVPWATREAAQAVLVPLTAAGRVPGATAAPDEDSEGGQWQCRGYASFCSKLEQDEFFASWFDHLDRDVRELASDIGPARARLVALQHALINLLDFLDESAVRFPRQLRSKIPDGVD
jgi:hypothetical protein